MSRISGRNCHLKILDSTSASRNISGRANAFTLSFSAEDLDVTSFGALFRERVADALRDWSLEISGFWDGAASQIDEILYGIHAACTSVSIYPGGSAACPYYTASAILQDYSVEGAVEGAVTYSATFMSAASPVRTA